MIMETYIKLKNFIKQISFVLFLLEIILLLIDFSYCLLLLIIIGNVFFIWFALLLIKSNKPIKNN